MLESRRLPLTLWPLAWWSLLLLVPALAHLAEPSAVDRNLRALTHLCEAPPSAEPPLLQRLEDEGIKAYRGEHPYKRPNYIVALTHLCQAVRGGSTSVDIQFYLGLSLNRTGHFAEAVQWLARALQGNPSLPDIHYHLGLAYFQSGLYKETVAQTQNEEAYEQAIEHFKKAIEANPSHARAQVYLGLSFSRTDEFEEAIPALEKALEHDPSLKRAHYYLGLAYFHTRNYARALNHFQEAKDFGYQEAAAWLYQGIIYYSQKRYEEAREFLAEAIKLNPALTMTAQYYRGRVFYDTYELERDLPAQRKSDEEAKKAFKAAQKAAKNFSKRTQETAQARAADPADARRAKAEARQSTVVRNARSYRRASRQYLAAIGRRARERRLVWLQGSIGFEYDDNVVLEANDDVIDFGDKNDGRMIFSFVGSLLPVRKPRWRLGVEYALFQSLHFDLDEFDLQNHTGRLFASVKSPRVTWSLVADYTFSRLDNERFLEEVNVVPSARIQQTKALSAVVSVRYRLSDFSNQSFPPGKKGVRDRDGWFLESGFDQYLTFNKKRSFVRLSYYYQVRRSEGSDWEYDGHRVGLGLRTLLRGDITLDVKWAYNRRNYLHRNSFDADPLAERTPADRDERLDDRIEGHIQLAREVWRAQAGFSLDLSIGYMHVSTLSNIDFFDYKRNIVTVMLSGRY